MGHERPHALIRRYRRTRRVKVPWPGQSETRSGCGSRTRAGEDISSAVRRFPVFDVGGRCWMVSKVVLETGKRATKSFQTVRCRCAWR
jgi:hypothetical protein